MVVTTHEGVPQEFYGAKLIGSRRLLQLSKFQIQLSKFKVICSKTFFIIYGLLCYPMVFTLIVFWTFPSWAISFCNMVFLVLSTIPFFFSPSIFKPELFVEPLEMSICLVSRFWTHHPHPFGSWIWSKKVVK